MFGVVFPNRSFPIDISTFSQIDTFHWILDMNTFVGEAYDQVSDLCIFLLNNFTLPPDKALAVYIQSPGSPFLYCGAVTVARPSAVLSLPWPEPGGQMQLTAPDSTPLSAKIGVSVEDLASLPSLDVTAEKRIERLAMKVGENLFNFMQSFCGVDGSKLIVPMDILDRWFKKFQEKAKRDPEYLKVPIIAKFPEKGLEIDNNVWVNYQRRNSSSPQELQNYWTKTNKKHKKTSHA